MTHAVGIDLNLLTWVKTEIDAALARATEALQEAAASADASTQMQFAHTHLHQVRGALSIISLDGLAQFTAMTEGLLGQMGRGETDIDSHRLKLAARAFASIGNYLEELAHGASDQPLRLTPLYAELANARGLPTPPAAELFYPDLSLRPPARSTPAPLRDDEARSAALRQAKAGYDQGLLALLRDNAPAGIGAMGDAVTAIEALQPSAAQRSLWWVATAFFAGLAEDDSTPGPALKRLCAQIEAHLRRLLAAPTAIPPPERLLRDLLYQVAIRPVRNPQQQAVRDCWQLDRLLPPPGLSISDVPLEPLLLSLQRALDAVRHQWDEFSAGTAIALTRFDELINALHGAARPLARPHSSQLLETLRTVAQWLRRDPLQHTDALALEVATALLLLDNDFRQRRPDPELATQMAGRSVRLQALLRGETLDAPADALSSPVPTVNRHEEQQAVAQLCAEMRSSLAQIEQTLDEYFRNQARHKSLHTLDHPLQQISGALSMLGETDALALAAEVGTRISALASAPEAADSTAFEALAHQLSALGFYLEALPVRAAKLTDFLDPAYTPAAIETAHHAVEVATPVDKTHAPAAAAEVAASVPPAVVAASTEADATETTACSDELEQQLSAASIDDLEDDDAAAAPAPEIRPPVLPASAEDVDAELLEIFIEEAHEVLATMRTHSALLQETPAQTEHLTTIRRSFHTLKGSGRMVGLNALGETAWELEQTLNRWLQLDWPATTALLALIDQAQQLFAGWVTELEAGSERMPDRSALVAAATALRNIDSPADDVAAAPAADSPPPAAEPEPAPTAIETETAIAAVAKDAHELADAAVPAAASPASLAGDAAEAGDGEDDNAGDAAVAAAAAADLAIPVPPAAVLPAADVADLAPAPQAGHDLPPTIATLQNDLPGSDLAALEPSAADAEAETGDSTAQVRIGDVELSTALYQLYVSEAAQHLATLEEELAQLAQARIELPSTLALRAAHTLAGTSGTARFFAVHELALGLEHELKRLRDRNTTVRSDELELLRATVSALNSMLEQIDAHQLPVPVPELTAALQHCSTAADTAVASSAPQTDTDTKHEAAASAFDAELVQHVPPASSAHPAFSPAGAGIEAAGETVIEAVEDEIDLQLLPIFLEEAAEQFTALYASLRSWLDAEQDEEAPQAVARVLHSLKGSARMAGAMNIGNRFHALESQLIEGQRERLPTPTLVDSIHGELDHIEQLIEQLAGAGDSAPPLPAPQPPVAAAASASSALAGTESEAAATLRVRAGLVDQFVNQAGEIGIARTRTEGELRTLRRSLLELTENVIRLRQQLREIEIQAETQMQSRIAQSEAEQAAFDPLEMDRFTRLQELTRMMAESVNDVTTVQQALLQNLNSADLALGSQARMNRELQQGLLRLRMLPFDSLAERLYRVVRLGARELGKRATLDLHDGGIEIDRSVLEKMAAPLEHLLRNAVDHGIESSAERLAAGKAESGRLVLSVRQEGNEIAIDLSDDGRGLDVDRIIARARSNGLLAADETPDARQLASLVFQRGLSTASSVSTHSGRGIGMDVVKSQTAALGGRIELRSSPGAGTRVLIHLPLTVAVTQALLVRAAQRSWAIPSNMIAQALEFKAASITEVIDQGGYEWQGEHYPYRYLPQLLGQRQQPAATEQSQWLLLLRAGSEKIALHVEELLGNQEIVVKDAGPQLTRIVGISGATVLADGEIALILNPIALATRNFALDLDAAADARTPAAAHKATVMVVDDSLTVRRITGRLLEREGYQVITAKDGVDALEQLGNALPDVLLSDIEMPRMDGFDLLRNIRADERSKDLPVIMITSRLAEKHRRYAAEIGANHYLGKPYQEEELLALIAGYCARLRADAA